MEAHIRLGYVGVSALVGWRSVVYYVVTGISLVLLTISVQVISRCALDGNGG